MLLKLIGLFSLIFLLVLLPQAQSGRLRFVTPHRRHTHTHELHHHAVSSSQSSSPLTSASQLPKPHIQMVTGFNAKLSQNTNFDIAMVTVPRNHPVAEQLGGILDTPVSGPNPGGNSESLTVSDNGQTLLGDMLDTPVSGPNPSGNSQSLLVSGPILGGSSDTIASMLDTPVSGPSPSGNSNTLGNMLDTPVSGPNPGGNSQGLFVAGPKSRGPATKLDNMLNTPVAGSGNSATLGDMLDTSVSGPNPGGNSQILSAVAGPNPGGNSEILAASSGPNPGGNTEILAASSGPNPGGNSQILVSSDGHILSAVSGPNPRGNSAALGSNLSKNSAQLGTSAGLTMSKKAEANTVFGELPRTRVPPSGPSPIHNSVATNQGLLAGRNLKGGVIGCEQEGERDSGRFNHFEAYSRTINNDDSNEGAASLTTA